MTHLPNTLYIKDLFSNKKENIIKQLSQEDIIKLNEFIGIFKKDFKSEEFKCEEDMSKMAYKFVLEGPKPEYLWVCELQVHIFETVNIF